MIFDAQVKDSNVYICTANGVTGSINITVREPGYYGPTQILLHSIFDIFTLQRMVVVRL